MPVGQAGGTLRVELNHADGSVLPPGFRNDTNDAHILAVAFGVASEGHDVTLVTKDMPLRVRAAAMGLRAEEYRHDQASDATWTGMAELALAAEQVDALYREGAIDADVGDLPCHTGLVLTSPRGSALGRVTPDKRVRLVRGDREVFGLRGRSAEQRIALDLLLDESVGIVSLGGGPGPANRRWPCAPGSSWCWNVPTPQDDGFPSIVRGGWSAVGVPARHRVGEDVPWAEAVFDTLGSVVQPQVVQEILARGLLEVLPLTHIRGRSLHDVFVIVDEAQSLERGVLLTVLSRIGSGSKVVLTHDVAQRDNLRVGRHDGVTAVIEALKGQPLFGHVTLTRSERSPIAELVTQLLEDIPR